MHEQPMFEELQRAAIGAYGAERVAEQLVQNALKAAARAVWQVSQQPLDPMGPEPLPTHD